MNNNILSINEITGKFKTINHFCQAYTDAGYLLIDADFVTWNYIKDVLEGTKKLVKADISERTAIPPR